MFTGVDIESIPESDITALEAKLKELIKENLNLNKIGGLIQTGLDKVGIPLNFEKIFGENPGAIFDGAKKMWGFVQKAVEGKSGEKLNLADLLPKGMEILKNIAKEAGKNVPEIDVNVKSNKIEADSDEDDSEEDPFEEMENFEAEFKDKDEL